MCDNYILHVIMRMWKQLLLCYLFLCTIMAAIKGGKDYSRRRRLTAEEQLIMDLFRGYDTDARAVVNTSATVTVSIQFLLLRIQRLDERSQVLMTTGLLIADAISQILMTTGLLIAEWRDERLSWDPKLYNNITDVVVRAERIWTPELAVINGADEMIQEFEKIRVLISSNGLVHWEPGGVFVTTCDIDIIYFPFDSQSCPIEIGAWAYKSSRMNLTNVDTKVETAEFKLNGEWIITSTAADWHEIVLPCCPGIRYSKVVFVLNMDRRYIFYVMNIILPCVLLSILILIVFCVPPDAGEKISAGISVLLAFTVFLLMLADNVPRTSLDVPILVAYLGSTMALGTLSVCLTVGILNLHHRGSHAPVPDWVRYIFLDKCAKVFGFPQVERKKYFSSNSIRVKKARPNNINIKMQDFDPVTDPPDFYEIHPPSSHLTPHHSSVHLDKHSNAMVDNMTDSLSCAGADSYLMTETILNEAMQYHNISVPAAGAAAGGGRNSGCSRRGSMRSQRGGGGPGSRAGSPTSMAARVSREEAIDQERKEEIIREWHLLARVLDRILFCIVFLTMLCCALFILLSPWYAGKRK